MNPTLQTFWDALTVSRRAWQATALLFACLLFVFVWVFLFSFWNLQLEAQFDAKTRMLEGLRRQGVTQVGMGEKVDTKVAAVSAPTETIAASSLQQYILNKLETQGESVHSIQTESSRDGPEGLQRLNAQLTFESSINSLQQLLFELETGTPFLFVDGLSMQPSHAQSGGRPWDRLRVSLAVSAYWAKVETGSQQ